MRSTRPPSRPGVRLVDRHPTVPANRHPRRAGIACRAAPLSPPSPSACLFILGLGYTGSTIAQLATDAGWRVHGSTRRREKDAPPSTTVHTLCAQGHLDAAGAAALTAASHVLVTVPPPGGGGEDPGLATIADALAWPTAPAGAPSAHPAWTGVAYLSSTTVYPYSDAIDEDTAPDPPTPAGVARVAAECAWIALGASLATPVTLVRCGTIYGPGRSALDAVRRGDRGKRTDGGAAATPRAHVVDVARLTLAALAAGAGAPTVIHATDDDPAPRQAVLEEAARLLGRAGGVVARSGDATTPGRRVSSTASQAALGVKRVYPGYLEGLVGVLEAEGKGG